MAFPDPRDGGQRERPAGIRDPGPAAEGHAQHGPGPDQTTHPRPGGPGTGEASQGVEGWRVHAEPDEEVRESRGPAVVEPGLEGHIPATEELRPGPVGLHPSGHPGEGHRIGHEGEGDHRAAPEGHGGHPEGPEASNGVSGTQLPWIW